MRRLHRKLITILLLVVGTTSLAMAQGGPIMGTVNSNTRTHIYRQIAAVAGLSDMYNANGPFTVLVPTDAAFSSIPPHILDRLKTDGNYARYMLLHHTLQGTHDRGSLGRLGVATTAANTNIAARNVAGTPTFGSDVEVIQSLPASNGYVHLIDGVLSPDGAVLGGSSPGSGGDTNAPLVGSHKTVTSPTQNPAYADGAPVAYWSGIQRESSNCKGMTMTVLHQQNGTVHVGSDRMTNPWRGDTGCGNLLPMVCHKLSGVQPSGGRSGSGWSYGEVRATGYIRGFDITSAAAADQICQGYFGDGWRMAEFHLGGMGRYPGSGSGWHFWSQGTLPLGERFWVKIADQSGNPWDSVQVRFGAGGQYTPEMNIMEPYQNPSYRGERRHSTTGSRTGCLGMTFVVLRQYGGMVHLGADSITNPYSGDTGCGESLPVACIHVDGYGPPPPSNGHSYSVGWSGAALRTTNPVLGSALTSREAANNICVSNFGEGWRMADFHAGSLGQRGTDGWAFWSYDYGVNSGLRIWTAINDQRGNPWN